VIFAVTYLLPFRFAVVEVEADAHAASALGVLFSGIGILAGIYYLIKDDAEKEGHGEASHH
ncbi:MAG TPA: hypothetical protein VN922_17740, partial [Bacteroidia bacterium]|nr:hypothetical protein [Bacteroidia bacterium]